MIISNKMQEQIQKKKEKKKKKQKFSLRKKASQCDRPEGPCSNLKQTKATETNQMCG